MRCSACKSLTETRLMLILFVTVHATLGRKSINLCSVDIDIIAITSGYHARITMETKFSEGMSLASSWQLFNKLDDGTIYEVPIKEKLSNEEVELSAFYTRRSPGAPVISHLQATSRTTEMELFYSYTIADDLSRTGISLVEIIDTKTTKDREISVDEYVTHHYDVIEVFVDDSDKGILHVDEGETLRVSVSYKMKYNISRYWIWRRSPRISDITSGAAHPLHSDVIAESRDRGYFVQDGYDVIIEEDGVAGDYTFTWTLVVESFDSSEHSAIYHFHVEDWSMADKQPWVLRVDKFVEVAPAGTKSLLEPTQLFPDGRVYLELGTCSKKASESVDSEDNHLLVKLEPDEPDCVLCLAYSDVIPQLTKDGVMLKTNIWPLTVRSPYLKLVYVSLAPSEDDKGIYSCTSHVANTPPQTTLLMHVQYDHVEA